jgi:hypothetical protein
MSVMKGKSSDWSCGMLLPLSLTADRGNTVGGVDFVTLVMMTSNLCQTFVEENRTSITTPFGYGRFHCIKPGLATL